MARFAEQVMPELRRACGGSPVLPLSAVELVPRQSTLAERVVGHGAGREASPDGASPEACRTAR
jgi:hypothetical protein